MRSFLSKVALLFLLFHSLLVLPLTPITKVQSSELPVDYPVVNIMTTSDSFGIGDNFTIGVVVYNLTDAFIQDPGNPEYDIPLGNFYGFDLELNWNPNIISYINHTITVPFEDFPTPIPPSPYGGVLHEPPSILELKNIVDEDGNISGAHPDSKARFAYSSFLPAPPFNGNGTILIMTFAALDNGESPIEIMSAKLADTSSPSRMIGKTSSGTWLNPPRNKTITILPSGPDIAVLDVTPSETSVFSGKNTNIEVLVENQGTTTETFNLDLYANLTIIATSIIENISPSTIRNLNLTWQTLGLSEGNYLIKAYANPVLEETYLGDNTYVDGTITILPPVYTLTIVVNPHGGGTTNPAPGSYQFSEGTSINITAYENFGGKFHHWDLDGSNVGTESRYTTIVNSNQTLTAVFVRTTIELLYDDGTEEAGHSPTTGLYTYAVHFQTPGNAPFRLIQVKYFIFSDPASFYIDIRDGSLQQLHYELITPTQVGWYTFNLSSNNIDVEGDFYVGMEYFQLYEPLLGADYSSPDDESGEGLGEFPTPNLDSLDWMIRADLEVKAGIGVLSPRNWTYSINSIPLTFTLDKNASWIGYSLDNQANVTISGNATLSSLSNGIHNVIVYASDTVGNTGSSERIYFTVAAQEIVYINQSQTWYGDFIVNEDDVFVIENCEFTVDEGSILVYGELYIDNCSLSIQHQTILANSEILVMQNALLSVNNSSISVDSQSLDRWIVTLGNLSVVDSRFPMFTMVGAQGDSFISNSEIDMLYLEGGSFTQIANSSLFSITFSSLLEADITGSNVFYTSIIRLSDSYELQHVHFSETNLTEVHLSFYGMNLPVDLKLQNGFVENTTVFDAARGWNFTFSQCSVDSWYVLGQNLTVQDSVIERIGFILGTVVEPVNLVLEKGFIEHKEIFVNSSDLLYGISITVTNSTVNSWNMNIKGDGEINIQNSFVSVQLWAFAHPNIAILNSTLPWITAGDFSGNYSVYITDSVINAVWLLYINQTTDLSLHDGYHECTNFYNDMTGWNFTIERTVVNHWSIGASSNSTVHLRNSTISSPPYHSSYTTMSTFRSNAEVYFHNSYLNGTVYCEDYASFTLLNSTLRELWAYEDCNITLMDSTIFILISDPPEIHTFNTTIYSEILLSFPAPSESLSLDILDDPPVVLPDDLICVSKFLLVGYFPTDLTEMQIRLYYDEAEITGLGYTENNLKIYFLDNQSGNWNLHTAYGVQSENDFCWADVTDFGYFVVALEKYPEGDVDKDGDVDIFDIVKIAGAYGSEEGDPAYDADCDIDDDGDVDIFDIVAAAINYGVGW